MTCDLEENGETVKPEWENQDELPIISHLQDLRKSLLRGLGMLVLCSIICGFFWQKLFEIIAIWPLRQSEPIPKLIYTAPAEPIILALRIAISCGTILAAPFIFHQIWSFVAPGLYRTEKAFIFPLLIASSLCFFAGIAYCYFLLPFLLQFLAGFASEQITPYYRINEYLSFLLKTCLAFGVAFEMPVLAVVLGRLGLINHLFLVRHFRLSLVFIFILAAVLTPPDVLSQLFLALPLLLLYLVSIGLVFITQTRSSG